ncbi:MAG: glycosyltransferase family 2 protein [Chitinophagales bacterium]|nr:glycosyltransferase family 2 protein [Hyphomicrobiales bacterium]
MKLAVIIPTLNRKALVTKVLGLLDDQTRPPDEVIVSAPDDGHTEPYQARNFKLSFSYGTKGSCAQRNRAMDLVRNKVDVLIFFDDDFLPARTYLENLEIAFEQNPNWQVIGGRLAADGAQDGRGYSFDEGLAILRAAENAADPMAGSVSHHPGAYGCNMSLRTANLGDLRFDERLALYGWQEDIDFTSQLGKFGAIVGIRSLLGVHLAEKAGRVNGVKFGYSQVCNPIYLMRKGTMPARFGLELMCRNMAANLLKSMWPEPYLDRRGRLKGNIIALSHACFGRIEPEYILKL